MMEKKCKNEDSPVSMKARTRRCGDDAPAARSFADSFSAMIQNSRLVYGLVAANHRVLKLPLECLFSTIIVCNVRLAVELIGRATIEKPKLYILPPKPENLYAKYYISHTHCWNYFTRKKKNYECATFIASIFHNRSLFIDKS